MAGPTQIRLDEALEQIVEKAHGMCAAAARVGGRLEGITEVVTGDRLRHRPDAPYLWVMLGAGEPRQARALHETWELALMLNAFVLSEEPEAGWLEAFRFAARARSVVLQERTLELGFVEDVQSGGLGPLGLFTAGRRFGAFARLNVRISIVEPKE